VKILLVNDIVSTIAPFAPRLHLCDTLVGILVSEAISYGRRDNY
jgi:hypothetical protein